MGCFACFDGGSKQRRREEDRLASEEARAKAAEAAQKRETEKTRKVYYRKLHELETKRDNQNRNAESVKRCFRGSDVLAQEQFEQSAAGRAAKAQIAAAAKQNANTNKGEPVLKWQMG
ncbi:hypothetical protein SASPL_134757 [Salvia splendens]|uniref:Small VCP/p97-interacting protein n=1 Tax=Salvia splendens TaxID=180675 RepID=A0A8X8WWX8_SALSN|nr:hypothetical protein SASPL_134757 [Salvia splendens]